MALVYGVWMYINLFLLDFSLCLVFVRVTLWPGGPLHSYFVRVNEMDYFSHVRHAGALLHNHCRHSQFLFRLHGKTHAHARIMQKKMCMILVSGCPYQCRTRFD